MFTITKEKEQKGESNTTKENREEITDMLMTALPAKPGTDLASKLLLQDSQLKNMIIAEVVGKGIGGEAYYVGPCDRHDGRKTDVVYLPRSTPTNELPPVIVEIQQKVNHSFMARAIRYCLDIFEETTIVPILVVFNVKGFSGTQYLKETFTKADDQCFYTLYCRPWAKSVYIYNADSIAKHMSTPLQPIIALAYFFTQQQRHLMTLDEFEDPTLHMIYRAAYTSFSKHCAQQSDQLKTMQEFCDAISLQFGKIITSAKENTGSSIKRTIKYAEDGVCFSNKMRRLQGVDESDDDVTPIESTIDENQSDDLAFVIEWRQNNIGKMNWSNCYDDGRKVNLFHRYKSHLSLKQAFNERKL